MAVFAPPSQSCMNGPSVFWPDYCLPTAPAHFSSSHQLPFLQASPVVGPDDPPACNLKKGWMHEGESPPVKRARFQESTLPKAAALTEADLKACNIGLVDEHSFSAVDAVDKKGLAGHDTTAAHLRQFSDPAVQGSLALRVLLLRFLAGQSAQQEQAAASLPAAQAQGWAGQPYAGNCNRYADGHLLDCRLTRQDFQGLHSPCTKTEGFTLGGHMPLCRSPLELASDLGLGGVSASPLLPVLDEPGCGSAGWLRNRHLQQERAGPLAQPSMLQAGTWPLQPAACGLQGYADQSWQRPELNSAVAYSPPLQPVRTPYVWHDVSPAGEPAPLQEPARAHCGGEQDKLEREKEEEYLLDWLMARDFPEGQGEVEGEQRVPDDWDLEEDGCSSTSMGSTASSPCEDDCTSRFLGEVVEKKSSSCCSALVDGDVESCS